MGRDHLGLGTRRMMMAAMAALTVTVMALVRRMIKMNLWGIVRMMTSINYISSHRYEITES